MHLVVLNVAFPFAPVRPDALGGAEQIVSRLDAALTRAGHESIVMACEGSVTDGILLATKRPVDKLDAATRGKTYEEYRYLLEKFLEKWPIDLIHMHGVDFHQYLPPPGLPVLVTLHLPVEFYPTEVFHLERPKTFLLCVSAAQHAACPPCAYLLPPVEKGGSEEMFLSRHFAMYEQLARESRAAQPLISLPPTGLLRQSDSVSL